jgi:uncharacterized protein YecT (DUF1311 family)
MKHALIPLAAVWLLASAVARADEAPAGQALVDQFCGKAQTTADMNDCTGKMLAVADKDLNTTYQAVLKKWANVPGVAASVRTAQRAWITYRDADIAARFADAGDIASRGTAYPAAHAMYQAGLVHERTARLCEYLRGASYGERDAASCADLARNPSIVPAPAGH